MRAHLARGGPTRGLRLGDPIGSLNESGALGQRQRAHNA